jgi:hypothetical protein
MREHAQEASATICGYYRSPRVRVRIMTAVRNHSEARRCGGGGHGQGRSPTLGPLSWNSLNANAPATD